jgi:PAS domain S-box-containing protein
MIDAQKKIVELEKENLSLTDELETLRRNSRESERNQHGHHESLAHYKTIFEESSLGNKIIDSDLKILKVNRKIEEMLGYKEAELVGKQIIAFTPPRLAGTWRRLQKELWLASHPRTSFNIVTCLIRKDGSFVWCQVVSIVFNHQGSRLGYTILEDISERIAAERSKAEMMEKEFSSKLEEQGVKKERELFENIVRTQEEERERIAEQLHNSLGQLLYAVKINLNQVKLKSGVDVRSTMALDEANKLLSESIQECRRTAHYLLPGILTDYGLKEAIATLCRQFQPALFMRFHFTGMSTINEKYAEIVIFRTIQELFLNIVKHAEASQGTCSVHIGDTDLLVTVTDNGKGFDLGEMRKNGIGLSAMKRRIEQMTGTFDISSTLKRGTTVKIALPRRKF